MMQLLQPLEMTSEATVRRTSTVGVVARSDQAGAVALIREHCDNGIRYYTWALKRMPFIPEQAGHVQHVESLRSALAHVLAFIEGAADERSAMLARPEIIERYERAVEDEGWEPPFRKGASPTD
jgi:hypothetical protein